MEVKRGEIRRSVGVVSSYYTRNQGDLDGTRLLRCNTFGLSIVMARAIRLEERCVV